MLKVVSWINNRVNITEVVDERSCPKERGYYEIALKPSVLIDAKNLP